MTEGIIETTFDNFITPDCGCAVCVRLRACQYMLMDKIASMFLVYPHTESIVLDIRRDLMGEGK